MPKFYVRSKKIRKIVIARDPLEAAKKVLTDEQVDLRQAGLITLVSEKGFDKPDPDTVVMLSEMVIGRAN